MVINWFPGHMKKTLESLKENIKKVDVVLYVLDSRAWRSTLNPIIDKLVENKCVLYVLNKCDLIELEEQKKILKEFSNNSKNAIFINGTENSASKRLIQALKTLIEKKYSQSKAKGIEPIFKVMVIGTPNTGKSTIINTLCGQKKTMTGDKAGVTKQNQWVKVSDNFALLDTPGTLWPNMDNNLVKLKLAFIGGIKNDVVDETELGFEFVKFMLKHDKQVLEKRYGNIDDGLEEIEVYDKILRKMGCIKRGNEVDYDRGGVKVLDDFRSGKLGRICLDCYEEDL